MALFHACVDTVWLRKLLKEAGLGDHVKEATIALGDNDQATRLSYEDIVTSGNRMIRNNYHFVTLDRLGPCRRIFPAWREQVGLA